MNINYFKGCTSLSIVGKEPLIHSFIAKSKSASGSIIAGFFASKPSTNRNLFFSDEIPEEHSQKSCDQSKPKHLLYLFP